MSEWGNPAAIAVIPKGKLTRGTETSQYPEERKANPASAGHPLGGGDSPSSGERTGNSPNHVNVKVTAVVHVVLWGAHGGSGETLGELPNRRVAESPGKESRRG